MFVVNDYDGEVGIDIPGTGSVTLGRNQATQVNTSGTILKVTPSGKPEASATISNSGTYTVNSSGGIDAGSGTPAIAGKCAYSWSGSDWQIQSSGSCGSCATKLPRSRDEITTATKYTGCS